jgi:toluene monooxygenase system protein D
MTTNSHQKMVGPVIRGADADLADAVIEAIEADNPGADVMVEDAGGYIRISVPQRCRLSRVQA